MLSQKNEPCRVVTETGILLHPPRIGGMTGRAGNVDRPMRRVLRGGRGNRSRENDGNRYDSETRKRAQQTMSFELATLTSYLTHYGYSPVSDRIRRLIAEV